MKKEKDNSYTTLDQIFGMIGLHLITCIIMLFTTLTLVTLTKQETVIKYIITIFNALFLLVNVYSRAYGYASNDLKPYHNVKAYPLKGIILPIGIILLVLASFAFYTLTWKYIPTTETYLSIPCLLATILYIVVTSPFYAFVEISGSSSNIYGLIPTLISPVIVSVIGYYFGYKKIDLLKHFRNFMFEKKN